MRLPNPLIPDWLAYCIAAPIVVIAAPAIAAGFAFAGLVWVKRRAIGPVERWRPWFAWYPVQLGGVTEPELRWLEMVDRRSYGMMQSTQFRAHLKNDPANV